MPLYKIGQKRPATTSHSFLLMADMNPNAWPQCQWLIRQIAFVLENVQLKFFASWHRPGFSQLLLKTRFIDISSSLSLSLARKQFLSNNPDHREQTNNLQWFIFGILLRSAVAERKHGNHFRLGCSFEKKPREAILQSQCPSQVLSTFTTRPKFRGVAPFFRRLSSFVIRNVKLVEQKKVTSLLKK